jgi:hypothetical protein
VPAAVFLTVLLVAVSAPHVAEDFQFGEFAHLGVPAAIPAAALGLLYACQMLGAYFAGRNSRLGYVLLAVGGVVWCVGALVIHGHEIIGSGDYRNGTISKALEVAIIFLGSAVTVRALGEVRAHRA